MKKQSIKRNGSDSGFSLIELSIALIILGVIIVPLLVTYNIYRAEKAISDTQLNQDIIKTAVGTFYLKNNRYPCPSDRSRAPSDVNYGKEDCSLLPAVGNTTPNCTGANNPKALCVTFGRDADGVGGPDPIYVGGVPFQDLQLSPDMALDGWAHQMTYAVTTTQTVKATFKSDHGAISVYGYDPVAFKAGNFTPVPSENIVHFVINSAGRDAVGAYTPEGKLIAACPTTTPNPPDSINCNNITAASGFEGVFFNQNIGGGSGSVAGKFHDDDIIFTQDTLPTAIWTYTAAKVDSIVTNSRIGVNTKGDVSIRLMPNNTPAANNPSLDIASTLLNEGSYDPAIQLDVNGTVGAADIYANAYCDDSKVNCFKASDLATTGPLNCGATTSGSFLQTIANDAPKCTPGFSGGLILTCPTGQNFIKIVGGIPKCG